MKYALYLSLLTMLLAAGCDKIDVQKRYGQLLSPSEFKECPPNHVPYVTMPNDSLYVLAERAYGEGYMFPRILQLEENKKRLKKATDADGHIRGGYILFLPPDDNGEAVKATKSWHFGGTGLR